MKWNKKLFDFGGSVGIIVPSELLKHMELTAGDDIVIQDDEGKLGKFVSFWKKPTADEVWIKQLQKKVEERKK